MDFRKPVPVAIAIAVLIAIVAGVYGWKEAGKVAEGVSLAERPDRPGDTPAEVKAELGQPAAPSRAPASASPQTTAALFAAAMTSSDPYALAVRYRAQRRPGSFAVARDLSFDCRRAYQMTLVMKDFVPGQSVPAVTGTYPVSNEGLSPEVLAKRAAASQEISARCRPFMDDREIDKPMADDASGLALRDMELRMVKSTLTPEDEPRLMGTFIEHGLLWRYWYPLASQETGYGYFDGEPNGGLSGSDFKRAVELAAIIATTHDEGGRADLRLLAACVYSALCDGDMTRLVAMDKPSDPALIARVRPIAGRIAEALRAGDLERFRRKP